MLQKALGEQKMLLIFKAGFAYGLNSFIAMLSSAGK